MNGTLKCARCNKPFYNCEYLHPIDPKGTANRRWVCSDCETKEENARVDPVVKEIENIILEANNATENRT